jgi:hypothetical protein
METARIEREIRRLIAAFRVEMTPENIAAYLTGFQSIDLRFLPDAVTAAIQQDADFPRVSRLIVLMEEARKAAILRYQERERLLAANIGTVQCRTCMDAGYVRRDLPVHHIDFGKAVLCPVCRGTSRNTRDSPATIQAMIEREHAQTDRIREAVRERTKAEPPPPGFASNVPVPETLGEKQIEANRARLAREVSELAERMRKMQDREGRQ